MPTQKQLELQAHLDELRANAKLDSWTSFVEELKVPAEIYPALVTNRPELLNLAEARALSPEEHQIYLALIKGLLETNVALRTHTAMVAKATSSWMGQMNGMIGLANQIDHIANFRRLEEGEG